MERGFVLGMEVESVACKYPGNQFLKFACFGGAGARAAYGVVWVFRERSGPHECV